MWEHDVGMRIGGHDFSAEVLDEIRRLADGGADLTRAEFSRQVCDFLGWRGANGRRQAMKGRKVLLALDRRGEIKLPPARPVSIGGRITPGIAEKFDFPRIAMSLAELGAVWLEPVDGRDEARSRQWWTMMTSHHPLGAGPLCGAQIRYFILSREGIAGGLSFSAPAWRVQARDEWIGWDDAGRQVGLSKVVSNSRFLILPGVKVPHLASHVLGLALRRVVGDWRVRYGVAPVLAETFVDSSRHRGTCYRAANWVHVGRSGGRGRQDRKRTAKLAIYRFLDNEQTTMKTLLQPHYQATETSTTASQVEFVGLAADWFCATRTS